MDTRGPQFSGKPNKFKAILGYVNLWTSFSKQTNKRMTGPMVLRWLPFDRYSMFLFHFEYSPVSSEAEFWWNGRCKGSRCEQRLKKKTHCDAAVAALGPPVALVSDWWLTSVSHACTIRLGCICVQSSLWPLHLASFFRFWSCKWSHSCLLGPLPWACCDGFHVRIYMKTYFVN